MALTTRSGKGTPLTHSEMDANLTGLADGTLITAVESSVVNFTHSGSGLTETTVNAVIEEVANYRIDVIERLRRCAKRAMTDNPYINPELIGAVGWAASTAYSLADRRSNGGKVYECTGAGTSASSGGPTGYGTGIVDGTAIWSFFGMQTAPVLSVSPTGPSLTNIYTATTTADAKVKYLGGNPVAGSSTNYNFRTAWQGTAAGNSGGNYDNYGYGIELMTDATTIVFRTDRDTSGLSIRFRVIVDGQYAIKEGTILSSDAASGSSYNTIDFTNVFGGARKIRRITFECERAIKFWGIYVDVDEKIWKPQDSDTIRAIFVGDSITAGDGADMFHYGWADTCGKFLGWRDNWFSGSSGTGYINIGSGGRVAFGGRLTDVTSNAPDVVVVAGGINDWASTTSAIQSAVSSYLSSIRTALTEVPIFVLGNWTPRTANATDSGIEGAIEAAVAALNDPRIVFIPTIDATDGAWLSGTGDAGSTAGDGNCDVYISDDGAHPTQSGHDYLGERAATAIRSWLEDPH